MQYNLDKGEYEVSNKDLTWGKVLVIGGLIGLLMGAMAYLYLDSVDRDIRQNMTSCNLEHETDCWVVSDAKVSALDASTLCVEGLEPKPALCTESTLKVVQSDSKSVNQASNGGAEYLHLR